MIDQGLALFFPTPHSFTGEDVLEIQAHGGPVVLQLLLARCLQAASEIDEATGLQRLCGLRIAQPGEFSERAFLNDKIDLAQAEAIADLIDASTETAARSAARSLSGEFSNEVQALLDKLVHLRMLVEATLDFPEEDIDFLKQADASGQLQRLQATLANVMQRAAQGAIQIIAPAMVRAYHHPAPATIAFAFGDAPAPVPAHVRKRPQHAIASPDNHHRFVEQFACHVVARLFNLICAAHRKPGCGERHFALRIGGMTDRCSSAAAALTRAPEASALWRFPRRSMVPLPAMRNIRL